MTLLAQQLKNAILDAKNQEVLEGQKAVIRLNDELMKKVSSNVKLTAEESEQLIYAGFYNLSAAKEAIATVIDCCDSIQNMRSEMIPRLNSELGEINKLAEELRPYINKISNRDGLENSNDGNITTLKSSTNSSSGLKF